MSLRPRGAAGDQQEQTTETTTSRSRRMIFPRAPDSAALGDQDLQRTLEKPCVEGVPLVTPHQPVLRSRGERRYMWIM